MQTHRYFQINTSKVVALKRLQSWKQNCGIIRIKNAIIVHKFIEDEELVSGGWNDSVYVYLMEPGLGFNN